MLSERIKFSTIWVYAFSFPSPFQKRWHIYQALKGKQLPNIEVHKSSNIQGVSTTTVPPAVPSLFQNFTKPSSSKAVKVGSELMLLLIIVTTNKTLAIYRFL